MKLEDQVVSLDLAKRLKEMGVKQESMFYWYWATQPSTLWYHAFLEEQRDFDQEQIYSAFTVAELGEMLPDEFLTGKDNGVWYWALKGETNSERTANSEADARAKMLVYILTNNLTRLQ